MPKGLVNQSSLNSIAEAINVLNGTAGTYSPSEMGAEIIDAIPTETASGNPVHITDAAAYPAESCVTTLEPVQDLHGYSNPWPAGGGKNLFDKDDTDINHGYVESKYLKNDGVGVPSNNWNVSPYIEVNENQNITISGMGLGTAPAVCFYDANKQLVGTGTAYGNNDVVTVSTPTDCVYLRFSVNKSNVDTAQLELGNTATTYEPYSNICPISGHTGVYLVNGRNVSSDGITTLEPIQEGSGDPSPENVRPILPALSFQRDSGEVMDVYGCEVDWVNGVLRVTKVSNIYDGSMDESWTDYSNSSAGIFAKSLAPNPGLKLDGYITSNYLQTVSRGATWSNYDNFISQNNSRLFIVVIKPITTVSELRQYLAQNPLQVCYKLATPIEIQLTPTEMERVKEVLKTETHSITFPQAQSPVYGCEVDWVNGVLRVDYIAVDLSSLSWNIRYEEEINGTYSASLPNVYYKTSSAFIAEQHVFNNAVGGVGYLSHPDTSNVGMYSYNGTAYSEIEGCSNALYMVVPINQNINDKLVYKLATPIEIPLTPEIITLLKGENNIWTDSGTSEIEYKVDLQSYIQKLIDEASASASALSVSPLSLGKSAVLTSTDGEDAGEIEDVDEPVVFDEEKVSDDEELPIEEETNYE